MLKSTLRTKYTGTNLSHSERKDNSEDICLQGCPIV